MIDLVIKWIVKLIMGSLEKMLYLTKKKDATEKVIKAEEKANEAKQVSDNAVSSFKLRLEQYRKSRESNLSRTINRVQSGSGETGANNSGSGRANKDTGRAD
jgi:hypothetical protein